ncbi:hypothetical protein FNV43_RR07038 [Rhamnella rubrinervis]|uniref:Uncharacterized protein n=1 Tax=Rhamnella rubrinervis TaxID=2594499 RepID=A0A8K0MM03_9ROSA|nr:hypothetical protein FNV43_RR07038 [Rhamnella rubrinervis]
MTVEYDNRSRATGALQLQLDDAIRTVHARIRQVLEVPGLLLQADVNRVTLQIQVLVAELQLTNINNANQNLQQIWAGIEAGLQAHPILGPVFEAALKEEQDQNANAEQNANGQNNPQDPVEMEFHGPPLP